MTHSWSTLSKKPRMSASKIHFTGIRSMDTVSASSAACGPASRPKPVRESQKIFLVNRFEKAHHCLLDDLVLSSSDAQRALPPVSLWDVDSSRGLSSIRSSKSANLEPREGARQALLILLPCNSIRSWLCLSLEGVEAVPKK